MSAVQAVYDRTLRPHLPRKVVEYNGVRVRRPKLLDRHDGDAEYEAALIDGVRRSVGEGDRVVIVGGGWGVSAVHAVREGAESVTVFEAGDEQVNHVRATTRLNDVEERVQIVHGVVGKAVDVKGDTTAPTINPADLPDCDVLELDCEGAELATLRGLESLPAWVVVEVHPPFGVDESTVRKWLGDHGYSVVQTGIEVAHEGVVVLTARR